MTDVSELQRVMQPDKLADAGQTRLYGYLWGFTVKDTWLSRRC